MGTDDKTLQSPREVVSADAITLFATSVSGEGPVPEELLGLGFERYEESGLLGEGGMGRILLCADARVGRRVAMKVVHPEMSERGDVRSRFLVEARVQGQLEHPAVVPVYDLGIDPTGALYFTMRRVRGRTLKEVLEAREAGHEPTLREFTPRRLLADFSKLCLALAFVHQHEVIHRDIKPANVMLGDYGEVYLLDWGLAKVLGQDHVELGAPVHAVDLGDSGAPKTSYGSVLGTPGYMSPEQAGGIELDARSDVYSLGAILFELLCGQPLHDGAGHRELLAQTMAGVEVRPSVRAPEQEVPPELEELIVSATALDAERRLANAREMHRAIEHYLDGDRDVERRRALAAQLVAEVEADMARARTDETARRRVLRSLAHALALDPHNRTAVRAMVGLMTEPPAQLPAAVRDELEELESRQTRGAGRTGAIAFLGVNLLLPLAALMGVRSWAPIVAMATATTATAVVSWAVSRLERPRTIHAMAVLVLGLVTASVSSLFFGPFVITPSLVAVVTLLFSLNHPPEWRAGIIVMGLLAMLGPWGLELAGALPMSMTFSEDGLTLLPRAVGFPAAPTLAVLVVCNVLVVVAAGAAMAPIRREIDAAQARIRVNAWQLRQMIPEEASEASMSEPQPTEPA